MDGLYERIQESVRYIQGRIAGKPKVGVIPGTGWRDFAGEMDSVIAINYAGIPGLLPAHHSTRGKDGSLMVGNIGGLPVVCMSERFHLYEGFSAREVAFPVWVLCGLGIKALFVTNAAGGINRSFRVGDLMLITDHINMTMQNPLAGIDDDRIGSPFIDMTRAYDPELVRMALGVARGIGMDVRQGTYAGVSGPSFETPAEITMLGVMGADAVGMSTVNEVIAARQMGVRVCGLSCITNKAAGLGPQGISEGEVHSVMSGVREKAFCLLREMIVASGDVLSGESE